MHASENPSDEKEDDAVDGSRETSTPRVQVQAVGVASANRLGAWWERS